MPVRSDPVEPENVADASAAARRAPRAPPVRFPARVQIGDAASEFRLQAAGGSLTSLELPLFRRVGDPTRRSRPTTA